MNMNIHNEDEDDIEIDTSWLDEFEKTEKDYKMFYAEDLSFIKVHYIYINDKNEIETIREDKLLFKTLGLLTKEDLMNIIKHNSVLNSYKYSLLSILNFNINIEPLYLKNFLKNKQLDGNPFLHSISIDSIKFEKSITFFHDINELIILFRKKPNKHLNSTKKYRFLPTCKMTRRNTDCKELKD